MDRLEALEGERARLLRLFRKARSEGRLALAGEYKKQLDLIEEQLKG